MSQPPSSWEPHGGQQDYPQGQSQNPYGNTESFGQQSASFGQQSAYTPPPQYGGYPPASYDPRYPAGPGGYGQPGYPPQYGTPYGPPGGQQRPGAALAAAVLSYIQAGLVLFCTFFVLAAGSGSTEFLLIGVLQLVSVGLLIFGAVQLTSGTGRMMLIWASGLQLALVVYYLIRFSLLASDFDFDENSGVAVVIPLFFAVMPAVALALSLNSAVSRFVTAKRSQAASGTSPWGQ